MKAAIYARYSSDNQRQESIDAQVRIITDYAKAHEIEIVKHYYDEAKSATSDNRPSFQRMIADAEKKRFDVILVHKLDRFARDKYDSVYYKRKLRNSGVRLISVTEQLDGSPESVILESMLEGMAEYYSRNLARECMKGLMENALKCLHTGGKPPFGYDVDSVTKEYKINQSEAVAVKEIFKMYMNYKSYKDIIEWLNSSGYRTKYNKPFQQTSIHSILRNEKYTGTYIFNATTRSRFDVGDKKEEVIRIENGVPAIISKEEFEAVQKRLVINKHKPQPFKATEPYLLSGKIFCGKCGGKMFGNRRYSRGNVWAGYQCSNRKNYKTCDAKEVKKELIESLILNHLEKEIFTDDFINDISDKVYSAYMKLIDESEQNASIFEDKLKSIENQIKNIIAAIADGMYHQSMRVKLDELELQKNEIINMITDERMRKSYNFSIDEIKKYLEIGKNTIHKPLEEQQKIIDNFIEKVVVYEDKFDIYLYINHLESERGYDGAPRAYHFISTLEFTQTSPCTTESLPERPCALLA